MPKSIRLRAIADDITGGIGLVMCGRWTEKTNVPVLTAAFSGETIAHDIVDHPRGYTDGSVEDEFEALGGMWFRQPYDNRNARPLVQQLGYALEVVFQDWKRGSAFNDAAADKRVESTEHDIDIETMVSTFTAAMRKGRYHAEYSGKGYARFVHAFRWHFVRGYNKAKKRWRWVDIAQEQYRIIDEVVSPFAERPIEGMVYVLSYGNADATCREAPELTDW